MATRVKSTGKTLRVGGRKGKWSRKFQLLIQNYSKYMMFNFTSYINNNMDPG